MTDRTYCPSCSRWVGGGVGHHAECHHSNETYSEIPEAEECLINGERVRDIIETLQQWEDSLGDSEWEDGNRSGLKFARKRLERLIE